MSSALYIFRLLWPFLKELLLGGVTLKEGVRTQKKRVFLLFFVSGLIFMVFLILPKFYQLSQEHVKLEKSIEVANVRRLEAKVKELEEAAKKNTAVAQAPTTPVVKDPSPVTTAPASTPAIVKNSEPPKAPQKRIHENPPVAKMEVKNDRKKAYMDFFDKNEE